MDIEGISTLDLQSVGSVAIKGSSVTVNGVNIMIG